MEGARTRDRSRRRGADAPPRGGGIRSDRLGRSSVRARRAALRRGLRHPVPPGYWLYVTLGHALHVTTGLGTVQSLVLLTALASAAAGALTAVGGTLLAGRWVGLAAATLLTFTPVSWFDGSTVSTYSFSRWPACCSSSSPVVLTPAPVTGSSPRWSSGSPRGSCPGPCRCSLSSPSSPPLRAPALCAGCLRSCSPAQGPSRCGSCPWSRPSPATCRHGHTRFVWRRVTRHTRRRSCSAVLRQGPTSASSAPTACSPCGPPSCSR